MASKQVRLERLERLTNRMDTTHRLPHEMYERSERALEQALKELCKSEVTNEQQESEAGAPEESE